MLLVLATIAFSSTILVLTLTQSVLLSLWIIAFVLLLVCIIGYVQDKMLHYSVIFCIATLGGYIAVQVSISQYNQSIVFPAQSIVLIDDAGYQSLLQKGTIREKQTHNRYLREAENGVPFFFYTEKNYNPGDNILVDARAMLTTTKPLSLFADYEEKKEKLSLLWQSYQFDFEKWQIMKGVGGSVYENNSIYLGQANSIGLIVKIKTNIQKKLQKIFGADFSGGLLLGMLIGDRSMMSEDDYQLFIDSGIVHIIAVSGGNIVMLVLFLHILLFRLPFYMRIVVILPCIIFYALICGLDASVLRAVIMGSLSLLALFRGKQTMVRRSLFIAYMTMLMINPFFLLYDIGFIFSFAAVIGIVYMTQRTQHIRFRIPYIGNILTRICHDYIFPSIGASMAIVPFLLFFTGKCNITSMIANMFVVPAVPIVMLMGGGAALFPYGYVGSFFSRGGSLGATYIYHIAVLTQKYGIYIMSHGYIFMYVLLSIILFLFVMDRFGMRKPNP